MHAVYTHNMYTQIYTFIYGYNLLQKKEKLFMYVLVFVKCDFFFLSLHGVLVFCSYISFFIAENYHQLGA